jgi:hypothetical protein
MIDLSRGAFDNTHYAEGSFREFLTRYPDQVEMQQEGTTTYVRRPQKQNTTKALHLAYRSGLKKQKLRVIPPSQRFTVLRDIIDKLQRKQEMRWRELIDMLYKEYGSRNTDISKNVINTVMLVARHAGVIHTLKGTSLSTAPVLLQLKGDKVFQEAIIRCDVAYLREILKLPEAFDVEEAAIALYDSPAYAYYLKMIMSKWMGDV